MVMRKTPQKPQVRLLILPPDLRKTMYEAIGEYVARSALFEFQLISAISFLAGVTNKKKRRISFMGMTFSARLGTFKALGKYWAPTTRIRDQIDSIVSAGHKIRLMRNSIAHGVWSYEKGGDKRRLFVYFAPENKDYYLPKSKHYTADQLRAKAKGVRRLNTRLEKLVDQLATSKIE
jgi:hypothetical protein